MSNTQKSKINYFNSDEGKKNALYKLWCAWLPQFQAKWQGRKTTVWFGLNKRKGNGLDWLLNKAKSLRHEFRVAHIYDNKTGKLLYTIPGSDIEALNQLKTENNTTDDNSIIS